MAVPSHVRPLLVACFISACGTLAAAQTDFWGQDQSWTNFEIWTNARIPGPDDKVIFNDCMASMAGRVVIDGPTSMVGGMWFPADSPKIAIKPGSALTFSTVGADAVVPNEPSFACEAQSTASSKASGKDDNSEAMLIVLIIVLVLVCLLAAVSIIVILKKRDSKPQIHTTQSFENPMYDNAKTANNAYLEPATLDGGGAQSTTGYMDVGTLSRASGAAAAESMYDEGGSGFADPGYLDVAPDAGAGGYMDVKPHGQDAENSGYMDVQANVDEDEVEDV